MRTALEWNPVSAWRHDGRGGAEYDMEGASPDCCTQPESLPKRGGAEQAGPACSRIPLGAPPCVASRGYSASSCGNRMTQDFLFKKSPSHSHTRWNCEALLAATTARTVLLQSPVTLMRVPSLEACVPRGSPVPSCAQLHGAPCTRGSVALPTDHTRWLPGDARPSIPCIGRYARSAREGGKTSSARTL